MANLIWRVTDADIEVGKFGLDKVTNGNIQFPLF
jgi:hypothetical protein